MKIKITRTGPDLVTVTETLLVEDERSEHFPRKGEIAQGQTVELEVTTDTELAIVTTAAPASQTITPGAATK